MMIDTEATVQRKIKHLAAMLGFHISDTSQGYRPGGRRHGTTRITAGFPDLFMMHPDRQIHFFVEVKKPGGKPTPKQEDWHGVARKAGVGIYVCDSAADFVLALRQYGFMGEEAD